MAGAGRTAARVSGDGNLRDLLARRIRAAGPISLAEYMEAALWDQQHGYYATRAPIGATGDFITAPEVSQIFGELIGLWCAELWRKMGAPEEVLVCELGPGNGTLMKDFLRAARVAPEFRRALRLHLVERSPALRAAQQKNLQEAAPVWHERLDQLPPGPLLLVANEFLDALPIRQFERRKDGWHERRIGIDAKGELAFVSDPAPVEAPLPDWPEGSVAELCPDALALAGTLAARLKHQGGAALLIDYGYFPGAPGDSFQAVSRHRRFDPLKDPGGADLTAHVDFAAFARAAKTAGARVWGPMAQGDFLTALGLDERAKRLNAGKTAAESQAIAAACRRLIEPAQMGSLFKALALTQPDLPAPAGFGS
jgi:NADH dehydrogenase [ubiquinone] 1 alpha subcomplex assembly factor 7